MASAAARTCRRSWVPIAPSKATQSPSGAARSRSRIRPRSQRFVAANRMVGVGVCAGAGGAGVAGPPREARRHHGRAGQASHRGARGRQRIAPTSMRAWVQSPGRSGGTASSATSWSAGAERATASPATIRPSTRRTLTSTAPDGRAEREGSDRARGVRPDPRERLEFRHGRWDTTAMLIDHDPGRPPQREGPPVVTETLPRPKDGRRGGCGERLHRGELLHEPLPVRCRARRLGLLGHRLGHEDRVRVASPPERERPALLRVPGEDRVPSLWRDARRGGHATRIARVKRRLMAG